MKILCILYDDPKDGMPSSYPVKELPKLEKYPVVSWVEWFPSKLNKINLCFEKLCFEPIFPAKVISLC